MVGALFKNSPGGILSEKFRRLSHHVRVTFPYLEHNVTTTISAARHCGPVTALNLLATVFEGSWSKILVILQLLRVRWVSFA